MARFTRFSSLLFFLSAAFAAAGCSSSAPIDTSGENGGPSAKASCVDADNDGYGQGCDLGADCDDASATVTDQCYRCDLHAQGCACEREGKRVECGKVTTTNPKTGRVECGEGGQVCENGKWSECRLGAYAPGHDGVTK